MMYQLTFCKKLLFLFAAVLVFTSAFAQAEPTYREKLARLETHLGIIEGEAHTGRIVGGWVIIGTGILTAGGGIILSELLGTTAEEKLIADLVCGGTGLVLVGTGALVLAIPSERETLPSEYFKLAQRTDDEILTKITKGEAILEILSQKSERGRIVGGVTMIGAGVAEIVAWLFTMNSIEAPYRDGITIGLLTTGITNCVTGVITLLVKSRAEQEWDSYKVWKKGEGTSLASRRDRPAVSVTPAFFGINLAVAF